MMLMTRVAPVLFSVGLTFLAGCATLPPVQGSDGVACVGRVENPPAGLVEVQDQELLSKSLGASGEGKLCTGKVFQANREVQVYRVWDKSKSYTLYGGWWSFQKPAGPKDEYRRDNDICPSWSPLNQMSSCKIKPGAKIVVGPGQSAKCEEMTLPKSPVNQVYIPNDSRNNVLYVEGCTPGTDWP